MANQSTKRYIHKEGKTLFVRLDLSGRYRVFEKPLDIEGDTFRARVCKIRRFGAYATFEAAQTALDAEAERRGWKYYYHDSIWQ